MPGRPTALAYSRARACCACSRCGMGGQFFVCVCFFHLVYPIFSFLMPHLMGDDWTWLKYCGLGCYNPTVVSVTIGGVLAKYWFPA